MPDSEAFPDNGDLGEPVSALESLESPASENFFARVQRKVWRHETVTEFVIFSLETPGPIFLEFAALLASTVRAAAANGGKSK